MPEAPHLPLRNAYPWAKSLLLALLSLGVIHVLDRITPAYITLNALYTVPVMIAAWGMGRSGAVGVALLATGSWLYVSFKVTGPFTSTTSFAWCSFTLFAELIVPGFVVHALKRRMEPERELRQALVAQSTALAAVLDNNPMSIQILDGEGRTIRTNPAFLKLFGSIPPPHYSMFSDPTLAAQGLSPVFDQIQAGEVVYFPEVSYNAHDLFPDYPDFPVWVRAIGFPICGADGRPERFVLMHEDVSQRRRAEQALRESEERFRSIAQASPVAMYFYRLEADGRLILTGANPSADRIQGIDHATLVGKTIEEAFPGLAATSIPDMYRKVARGELGQQAFEMPYDEGGISGYYDVLVFRTGQGTIAANFHDITQRKRDEAALRESNQRLQLATDSARLAVWDWDLQTGAMSWDDRMFELYGTTRLEADGTVQDWKDSLHPEDLERAMAESEAALRGEAPFDTEFRVRHRDGTVLWLKGNATVLRDQEGHPVRMVGVNRDVTDLHRAEEERARLQAQLLQSQKMESLGTLAGGVAHDMNNVLGAILGLASAHIGSQPYGSPLHQAFDTICKATERGGKMVRSLLSFARHSPAESTKVDMNAILKEQVALLERTTLAKVRLQMNLDPELRPILGDANALTHAFMNLCVNAVDAMPESGTLTLHTRNVDSGWIEVVVEDSGMGMPKEILERAMEPFFTTKETGKGTGLGLSMVFSTMKAHRGQMSLQSEPGKGTRVMLRFPASLRDTPVQAAAPAFSEGEVSPRGAMKVLLVDDDDLVQSSVQAILEALGHAAVKTAQSGEEALALLESGLLVDLVILDMNMPGLGGIGTLPRLRVLRPEVPVLLATGRVDQTALTLASAHPGVTLLSKPFGMKELQKHLENIGLG